MRQLNGIYTQWFNAVHRSVGHIFQGRYKAILVERDSHLLELCRYIVLNPVRAGITKDAGQWQWSSYGILAGIRKNLGFLQETWILSQFADESQQARGIYRRFIGESDLKTNESPWDKVKGQIAIGGETFIEKIEEMLERKGHRINDEFPKVSRYVGRRGLKEVFAGIQSRQIRNRMIVEAHEQYGYTQKEIGTHLCLHYSTVSRIYHAEKTARNKT